jgi:hypothetical protein
MSDGVPPVSAITLPKVAAVPPVTCAMPRRAYGAARASHPQIKTRFVTKLYLFTRGRFNDTTKSGAKPDASIV